MTVSHSAQMLLKLEICIPISHVTLETVPKYANIERPTSSQLYASRLKSDCFTEIKLSASVISAPRRSTVTPSQPNISVRVYMALRGRDSHEDSNRLHFFVFFRSGSDRVSN